MSLYRMFAITSLVLLLSACAPDAMNRDVAVRDSAGIAIVEIGSPVARGGLQLAAEPLVEIGRGDGPAEYQFYRVAGAARLADGRIVVLNAGTHQIRFYSTDGRFLSAHGGEGRGPGEFRYPMHLQVVAGDSIVIWDAPLGPRVVFAPDGSYAGQTGFEPTVLLAGLRDHFSEGFVPLDGSSVLLTAYERERGDITQRTELYRPVLGYMRVTFDGTRIDTLGWYGGIRQRFVDIGGRRQPVTMMFGYHAQHAAGGSPLRIYTGDTERFDIRMFDEHARLLRIIRRTTPPPPVAPQHVRAAKRDLLERADQQSRRAEAERVLAASPIAPHYPAFSRLYADTRGRLWVEEYAMPGSDTARFTAFDEYGSESGTLTLPRGFRPLQIGDDHILGVAVDELGVENIRLYALARR
jgi:hypothetical protein